MVRIVVRLVLALLFFFFLAAIIWVWSAQDCFAWDPPPCWRRPATCGGKLVAAKLAWLLSFVGLIWWAVRPKKTRRP